MKTWQELLDEMSTYNDHLKKQSEILNPCASCKVACGYDWCPTLDKVTKSLRLL